MHRPALPSVACVEAPWGEQFGTQCTGPEVPDLAALPAEQAAAFQAALESAAQATSPVSPDGTVAYGDFLGPHRGAPLPSERFAFDQPGFVQGRAGVRRAGQRGNATGHRRMQLRFDSTQPC